MWPKKKSSLSRWPGAGEMGERELAADEETEDEADAGLAAGRVAISAKAALRMGALFDCSREGCGAYGIGVDLRASACAKMSARKSSWNGARRVVCSTVCVAITLLPPDPPSYHTIVPLRYLYLQSQHLVPI